MVPTGPGIRPAPASYPRSLRELYDWATASDFHTAVAILVIAQFALIFNLLLHGA